MFYIHVNMYVRVGAFMSMTFMFIDQINRL